MNEYINNNNCPLYVYFFPFLYLKITFLYLFSQSLNCTTKVTFDDIPGQSSTSGIVPNTYKNLNWTNTYYLNASSAPSGGYQMAVTSSDYVAYNPWGSTVTIVSANGTKFAFNSVQLSSAWRSNLI